jgi:hypothetical protein
MADGESRLEPGSSELQFAHVLTLFIPRPRRTLFLIASHTIPNNQSPDKIVFHGFSKMCNVPPHRGIRPRAPGLRQRRTNAFISASRHGHHSQHHAEKE